jgi:hypothetical protein
MLEIHLKKLEIYKEGAGTSTPSAVMVMYKKNKEIPQA